MLGWDEKAGKNSSCPHRAALLCVHTHKRTEEKFFPPTAESRVVGGWTDGGSQKSGEASWRMWRADGEGHSQGILDARTGSGEGDSALTEVG